MANDLKKQKSLPFYALPISETLAFKTNRDYEDQQSGYRKRIASEFGNVFNLGNDQDRYGIDKFFHLLQFNMLYLSMSSLFIHLSISIHIFMFNFQFVLPQHYKGKINSTYVKSPQIYSNKH
jgi:hypothetical protein